MLIIESVFVSEALLDSYFHCKLTACKGACCKEGDFGAPLEEEEMKLLVHIQDKLSSFLSEESVKLLSEKGGYMYYPEQNSYGTTLHEDGACVYMVTNELGIHLCGIEMAYHAGEIDFIKPISCHLYPIRRKRNNSTGFEALNYDEWDICNPACSLGEELKLPLYAFTKPALVRAYGEEFYSQLEDAALYIAREKEKE